MKKILYTLLIATGALFVSCNKESGKGNLIVTGKVDGFKQGNLYLYQIQDTVFKAIDSLAVTGDSSFKFDLNIDSPEVFFLTLDRGHTNSQDNQIMFFAEPGQMTVNTTLKNFYADAKVTGSKSQETYENYLKTRSAVLDKQNELLVARFNAEKENNTAKIDSITKLSKKFLVRKYLNAVNFALNHKDSDATPYIALTDLYDANVKYLDTIYKSLSPEVMAHKYGKQLEEFIKERKAMEEELKNNSTPQE
ncbi:DUF4369 domain-containing protein [Myroides phaeus]|uniref:DUF4369 domain-containing protein n=1 Tax=Myroides phaeus TaxID=702745 RepID=A0A1G8ET61_9FLAO|nr:DUF4369 domain-containing protein [Myroides phaeus]MEC4116643.1 DUF4369 domain-containing protein [Myroides phaeus]SDH73121.1 protein of unknown function [Myroides phaeus]